jgi:hypothetical protein
MQRAEALLEIIHEHGNALTETDAGEPGAVKIARPVRRGAVGKGPDLGYLADGLPCGGSVSVKEGKQCPKMRR